MGEPSITYHTMNSSTFLLLSLAVVIAIASCAPKDSVDPFDVVPESDTLLQLKQQIQQMADLSAQHSEQMADLSAQNSALRQRVQSLEESLSSTTSPAESLLEISPTKLKRCFKRFGKSSWQRRSAFK